VKITSVRTVIAGNPWKNWLFALVETDEGITGVGEGTLNAFASTVETAIHEPRPAYIGQDPFQPAVIAQRMRRDVYSEGGAPRTGLGAGRGRPWRLPWPLLTSYTPEIEKGESGHGHRDTAVQR